MSRWKETLASAMAEAKAEAERQSAERDAAERRRKADQEAFDQFLQRLQTLCEQAKLDAALEVSAVSAGQFTVTDTSVPSFELPFRLWFVMSSGNVLTSKAEGGSYGIGNSPEQVWNYIMPQLAQHLAERHFKQR